MLHEREVLPVFDFGLFPSPLVTYMHVPNNEWMIGSLFLDIAITVLVLIILGLMNNPGEHCGMVNKWVTGPVG